ncbi:MAG: hypothetical protein IJ684_06235 [Bacteroidales bacterium]|nr:hypothetical protein [Bacteroidales bacterium]
MKVRKMVAAVACCVAAYLPSCSVAQTAATSPLSTLRLEMRADYDHKYLMPSAADNSFMYGFVGRYFNLHAGGDIADGFSYYFRQRVIADNGRHGFFDNTDFLYLNYRATDNWSFRFGKDALAVGGFEYDAPPIDVYFNGNYWDQFYCFQLGASAAYTFDDGRQSLRLQVANSPDLHSDVASSPSNYLSYNLLWSGNFGHFQTLYSASLFERRDGGYLSYVALGNRWVYDDWSLYVDLMHHGSQEDWLGYLGFVTRADVKLNADLSLFAKGGYEWTSYDNGTFAWDFLSLPCRDYLFGGFGVEYRPAFCRDIRLHAFLAASNLYGDKTLTANVGATWNVNFARLFKFNNQ